MSEIPSNFLADANVTVLARQVAWSVLSEEEQAAFTAAQAESDAEAEEAEATPTNRFTTLAATDSSLGSAAFDNRLDPRSATPTTETLTAFAGIWGNVEALQSQISDGGQAIFVTLDDQLTSSSGDPVEDRLADEVENSILDRFGDGQALLGYDLNGNGYLDDETELFGFDAAVAAGLDIDNFLTTEADGTQRLTADSNYQTNTSAENEEYNRFMLLLSDGSSVGIPQFDVAYGSSGETVAGKSFLQFDDTANGGATLSVRTQSGLSVDVVA